MLKERHPEAEVLLDRARAGDAAALGRLLDSHYQTLLVLARVRIGCRLRGKAEPADLVQEVFLEAARDFPAFRGSTACELAAWLRQILAHNLANLVRHYCGTRARDVRLERDIADELDRSSRALDRGLFAHQGTPSEQAGRHELADRLAEAIGRLPEDYGEVLLLRHVERLTFPEVAARMERSRDSVEKLWTRALARLREVLGASP